MIESLRVLLDGILDYAGLFPPAKLPLPEAAANFARYHTHAQSFMLSRFICPATQLAALAKLSAPAGGWQLSVLIAPGDDRESWTAHVEAAVAAIEAFKDCHSGAVDASALELRLPVGQPANECLATVARCAPAAQPYFEIALEDDVSKRLAEIASWNSARAPGTPSARAKIRTGGVEASMFPSCGQVAEFIGECQRTGIAFKATAGLHHPLRHFNEGVGADMHGFINVFVAAVLAFNAGVDRGTLVRVLEDRDPEHFCFENNRLLWGGHALDLAEIRRTRREFVDGFGSCSFDEPVEDLAALYLM